MKKMRCYKVGMRITPNKSLNISINIVRNPYRDPNILLSVGWNHFKYRFGQSSPLIPI